MSNSTALLNDWRSFPFCFVFSLLGNPVVAKKNYRYYVIHKIPSLRVLDFNRIKQRVSIAAVV